MVICIASSSGNSRFISCVTSKVCASAVPRICTRRELETLVTLGMQIPELVLLDQFTVISLIKSLSSCEIPSHYVIKILLSHSL